MTPAEALDHLAVALLTDTSDTDAEALGVLRAALDHYRAALTEIADEGEHTGWPGEPWTPCSCQPCRLVRTARLALEGA